MGCICSKSISPIGDCKCHTHGAKSLKRFVTHSKKGDVTAAKADVAGKGNPVGTPAAVSKPQDNVVTTPPTSVGEGEKKAASGADKTRNNPYKRRATFDVKANGNGLEVAGGPNEKEDKLEIINVPNGFSGEHAAAGWPSWLTAVAGEAIKGWLPRRASSFEKLDKIGQGTYSSVYRARNLETGKTVALKKVRFVNMDPESVRFMAREIHILRCLDHPNVINLEGIVTSQMSCNLYLVFDYMEHDLSGLAARPGVKFTEPQVKCFMQQLLEGLAHCHNRGVLHRDIKGSNLLIDDNGILKIADFGLATSFSPSQKQPLTSRVVTLWYRPPELLLGATEYGVAVDLWSSGCILAELLAGKPIMPGRTEVEQLHKIFKLCGSPSDEYWKKSKLPHATMFKPHLQYRRCVAETFKDFPSSALTLLDSLLAIEPANRGTAASALDSEFFKTKPFACDPSSLPKCPPSKEYDVKLQDEERRRKRAEATREHSESVRPGRTKAIPGTDANMELQLQALANPKSSREAYNAQDDVQNGFYHSAKKVNQDEPWLSGRSNSSVSVSNGLQLQTQRSYMPLSGAANFSGSAAAARSTANSRYNRLDVAEPSDEHLLDRPVSTHKTNDRITSKGSTVGYGARNKRIHYSGPLIPAGGTVEDMLKEHERQIQQAVRNAHLDKVQTKKNYLEE